MAQIVTVTYENGLLRPLTALNLPENQPFQIQILLPTPLNPTQHYLQELARLGLVTPPTPSNPPMSELARRKLAQRLGQATSRPLSEIIIEERGADNPNLYP